MSAVRSFFPKKDARIGKRDFPGGQSRAEGRAAKAPDGVGIQNAKEKAAKESQTRPAPPCSVIHPGGSAHVTRTFGVISIDGEQIPAEERPGTAKKLLASSALYCYCAALDKALETRSAKYRRIEGKATVRTGTDDKGRGRVTGIDLDVTVFMDQEYEFIFDRVEKIMKQGCLITGSLEAAFPVKYNLNLECDED